MKALQNLRDAVKKAIYALKNDADPFGTRSEWEDKLTSKLRGQFRGELTQLMNYLGDPPQPERVPESFWTEGRQELRSMFMETMVDIALEQAAEYLTTAPVGGVDWGQINQGAVDWARSYTYDLVHGLETTTRDALRDTISTYYTDGTLTIDDVRRSLEFYYSPERANMIAVTEVTRAAVQGEREVVKEIERYGIRMQAYWATANDDIVCEICGPRNDEPIEDDDYPPAHPNCRCGVRHEVIRDAN